MSDTPGDATKRAAIEMVVAEWHETDALFRALTQEQLETPVFTGEGPGWRVRDIVPHLALWRGIAVRVADKVAAEDRLPDTPDWDLWAGVEEQTPELNDMTFREWRERSLEEALQHLRETSERLVAAMERLRPDQIASGETLPDDLHPFLRAPGVRHMRNHRKHVEAALSAT